jgi:membrane protease YdiL (CAAX protease family)
VAEELFFRGLLFGVLRSRLGVAWGVILTGALFSLVHAVGSPAEALIVLFVLGAGLCLLYLRTGSLLPCIGLHALNNSIAFAVTKELEWPVAVLTVVGSVVVAVAIGMAFVRPDARVDPA